MILASVWVLDRLAHVLLESALQTQQVLPDIYTSHYAGLQCD